MNYYEEIKKELINNEINRRIKNYSINKGDLSTYYNVGKMISDDGNIMEKTSLSSILNDLK